MADWPLAPGGNVIFAQDISGATNYGVAAVAATPAHTKGVYSVLRSALPWDVGGLWLQSHDNGDNASYLVDLSVGATSAEQVAISNLYMAAPATDRISGHSLYIPMRFAKGTQLSIRSQSSFASSGIILAAQFMGSTFSGFPGYSRMTTYGADTATTGATVSSLDPGGTANTKSAYQTITASTTNAIKALYLNIDIRNTAATSALWRVDIAMGASDTIIIPDLTLHADATSDQLANHWIGPFFVSIPAGVALKVRAQCSITDATDRVIRAVIIYGLD